MKLQKTFLNLAMVSLLFSSLSSCSRIGQSSSSSEQNLSEKQSSTISSLGSSSEEKKSSTSISSSKNTSSNSSTSTYVHTHYYYGQDWQVSEEPTLTSTGLLKKYCVACDYSDTIILPVLNETDYNYTLQVPPTCEKEGFAVYNYSIEDQNFYFEIDVPAIGPHDFSEWIVGIEPTLDSGGYIERHCSKSNYDEDHQRYDIPALNNSFYNYKVVTEATCSDPGIDEYSFEYDSQTFKFQVNTNQINHQFDSHHCTYCGYTEGLTIENGVVKSYGSRYYGSDNTITIPSRYDGYDVTTISASVFHDCTNITSITLPNSITEIKNNAFSGCSSLTSINLPDSITSIGSSAFNECSSLTSITLPSSITKLSKNIFNNCSKLQNVTIPNGITAIEDNAFSGCSSFTDITIPDSVTSLGKYVFSKCTSLTNIVLPKNLTTIPEGLFEECSSLLKFDFSSKIVSIGNSAFYGCKSITSLLLPDTITSIGSDAFCSCSSLTSINLPNQITEIASSLFLECPKLNSIDIPSAVTSIGDYAFHNCSNLNSIGTLSSLTSVGGHAFSGCKNLSEIILPETVTSIGALAFSRTNISTFTIPNGVTEIQAFTFSQCSNLESVIIPDSVTSIGYCAFNECTKLSSINLPNNLTKLGNQAFNITSINDIFIPKSVTEFGGGSIGGYSSYGSDLNLYYEGTIEDWLTKINFTYTMSRNTNLYIKEGNDWKLIEELTIPNSITEITKNTFARINLKKIIIPSNVTKIDDYAFSSCSKLTSVTFQSPNISLGKYAFTNCSSLEEIKYNGTIEDWCSKVILSSNTQNIKTILTNENCKLYLKDEEGNEVSYQDLKIPETVSEIKEYTFYGLDYITSVTLPSNIKKISSHAFSTDSIKNVYFDGTISEWCNINFKDETSTLFNGETNLYVKDNGKYTRCYNLEIPDTVTEIKQYTFYKSNIDSVQLSKNLTTIGEKAFAYCSSLNRVYLKCTGNFSHAFEGDSFTLYYNSTFEDYCSKATDTSIFNYANNFYFGKSQDIDYVNASDSDFTEFRNARVTCDTINDYAFYNYSNLKSLELTANSIGTYAFSGCKNLESLILYDAKNISYYAFSDCTSLNNVILADVDTIGAWMFKGCSSLKSINVSSATAIYAFAFENTSLESIILSKNMKLFATAGLPSTFKSVFSYATNMSEVGNIKSLPDNATLYLYSEDAPTSSGNYWHYVGGEATPWEAYVESEE